ncbi:MAG TPA: gamma carbonic anhydrase family protein [Bacteroidetes bacterium]|nr:gamma carbonic anhydrase family protein [Bacteroidota bacterium]
MALIKSIKDISPVFGDDTWFAENATIVGDVKMGKNCSIWYHAVIRGDVNSIIIGDNVNIQDGAIIHNTYEKTKTRIGNNVSIAHNAVIHGCTLEDNVLIGIGAIILDNAYIESNSVIAAGAVVLENTRVISGSIYAGIPAKCIKTLSPDMFKDLNERIAGNYPKYAKWNNKA